MRAEMHRLRTQLNPHFLFNTLNAISELGYNDPEFADQMITQLSKLLRKALNIDQHEIALRDELDFLERYLAIQKTLLRDRLQITFLVSEQTLNARVPGMILQPLVENALTHGIGRSGVGHVTIRTDRQSDTLIVDVEDDGPGIGTIGKHEAGKGIGLSNTRLRLQYLYGDLGRLELRNRPCEGLTVRLIIPFHEAYAYDEASRLNR